MAAGFDLTLSAPRPQGEHVLCACMPCSGLCFGWAALDHSRQQWGQRKASGGPARALPGSQLQAKGLSTLWSLWEWQEALKGKLLLYHHVQTLWAQIKHSTQQGWQGPTQHINKPARFPFRVLLQRSFAHTFHHTGKCTPLPHTQFKGRKEKGLKALLSFMLIRRVIRFFRHWNRLWRSH